MTIVHLLKLPSHLQADSFEEFARARYLPALHTGSTRAGQLLGARLLRRQREHESDPPEFDNQFLLLVEWSGVPIDLPRVDDAAVQKVFDAFSIEVSRMGGFDTVGTLMSEPA